MLDPVVETVVANLLGTGVLLSIAGYLAKRQVATIDAHQREQDVRLTALEEGQGRIQTGAAVSNQELQQLSKMFAAHAATQDQWARDLREATQEARERLVRIETKLNSTIPPPPRRRG